MKTLPEHIIGKILGDKKSKSKQGGVCESCGKNTLRTYSDRNEILCKECAKNEKTDRKNNYYQ